MRRRDGQPRVVSHDDGHDRDHWRDHHIHDCDDHRVGHDGGEYDPPFKQSD
jgi:hypothetical protein